MVLIREYRIALPLSTEEYKIAQLYMVSKFSRENTAGGEGVEILTNEPYENENGKGQFTHKRIYLGSHIPYWAKSIMPGSILYVEEKAWNAFPYVKTVYTCPFFGDRFSIIQETRYMDDDGKKENANNLSPELLNQRQVDYIDILLDKVDAKYYKVEEDPKFFKSKKTGRGPLTDGWQENNKPVMWVYKVATVEFRYWGFQTKIEQWLQKSMVRDVLVLGHKQAFTWMDEWFGLTLEEIRLIEDETKIILDKLRKGEKVDNISIDVSRFANKDKKEEKEDQNENKEKEDHNEKKEEKQNDDNHENNKEEQNDVNHEEQKDNHDDNHEEQKDNHDDNKEEQKET